MRPLKFRPQMTHQSIPEKIANYIEEMIASNQIKPLDRLPSELELAKDFGVSRTTVGEALAMLDLRGLISRKPGRGTIITEMAPDILAESIKRFIKTNGCTFNDFLQFRRAIEPEIAALAAQNATKQDILDLKQIVDKMKKLIPIEKENIEKIVELDVEFHIALAAISKNNLFLANIIGIKESLRKIIIADVEKMQVDEGFLMHVKIYEAVAAKNPELARKYTFEHMDISEHINELIEKGLLENN